ncbi:hypothetical protein MJH12_11380 [bacterium]|nr:hypothetical protein [bacterium]
MKYLLLIIIYCNYSYSANTKLFTKRDVRKINKKLLDIRSNKAINGVVKINYSKGTVKSKTTYKNGIKDGVSKLYFKNGRIKAKIFYKNGLKEGLAKSYFSNGKIKKKSQFKKDVLNGLTKEYLRSGLIKEEMNFLNGEEVDTVVDNNCEMLKHSSTKKVYNRKYSIKRYYKL